MSEAWRTDLRASVYARAKTKKKQNAVSHMESKLTLWSEEDNSMLISIVCNQFLFSRAVVRHYRQKQKAARAIFPFSSPP